MEFKHVLELIEKMENSSITNLELTEKEFTLKLEKGDVTSSVKPDSISQNSSLNAARQEEKQESALKGNIVTAPIVGTFYQSSSPEKEPFVKVGQTIQEGDVVCIIEAMKLFNEVQSDYSGVVKKILAQDGDLMEYGQPIMIIE